MKHLLVLCAVAALLLFHAAEVKGEVWLADYWGYDYTRPLPNDFTTEGQTYEAVGPLVSMNDDFFILDEDTYEYTMFINSGALSGVEAVGNYIFYHYGEQDGVIKFFEDLLAGGTPYQFGVNPPSETCPGTFTDGVFMLGGTFSDLTIVINTDSGIGSLSGTINFDSGDYLANIPPDMRDGWTFSALGRGGVPLIPDGFMYQTDGSVYLEQAIPVQQSSWGRIKRLHRE